MVDILHRVGVDGRSPADVYEALTTIDGLAGWWTTNTVGNPDVGGTIEFRFPNGQIDMQVLEREPEHVQWRVVGGPDEWMGSLVDFRLRNDGDRTIVLFTHHGWKEPASSCTTAAPSGPRS
jgi:uncharacterized protein YndB with AHSA1/START domain